MKEDDSKPEESNMKVEAHVLLLYELLEVKGKGAYGIVWKARDKQNKEIVALKKVTT
jgi:mitogen-activated protein kinase 15